MNLLGNPAVLIILALAGVVIINLLLIASVQSHSKRTEGKPIRRILRLIREPFREGDSNLDELAELVGKLESDENNASPKISK